MAQSAGGNTGSPSASLGPVYFLCNPTANLARMFANPAQLPLASADVPVTNLCDPTDPLSAIAHCRRPLLVSSSTQPQQLMSPYAQCLSTKCRSEWQNALDLVTRSSNSIAPLSASDVHGGTQLHLCGIRSCASELTIQLSTVCVSWSTLPAGTTLDRPPDPKEPAMTPDLVSRYAQVSGQPERIGVCLPSLPIGSPCSPSPSEMFDRDGLLLDAFLPQPSTNSNDGLLHLPDSFRIPNSNVSAMYRLPPSLLRTPNLAAWIDRTLPNMNVPDNTFSLFYCSSADNNTIRPALLPGTPGCSAATNTSCAFTSCVPSSSLCANPVTNLLKRPIAPAPPTTRGEWAFNPLYVMPGVVAVAALISLFACIQNRRMIRSKKTRSILDRDRALRPADRRMLDVSAVQEAGIVGRPGDVLPRYAHHGFDLRPEWHPPNEEDLIYTDDGVEVAEVSPERGGSGGDSVGTAAEAAEYDRPPDEPVNATNPGGDAAAAEARERTELTALYLAGSSSTSGGGFGNSFTASPLSPPGHARTREGSRGVSAAGSLQAQQYRRQQSGMPSQLGMVGRGAII